MWIFHPYLCNKQDITWPLGDTNFIFSLRSLVRNTFKAPSTRIRRFLNPQLFLSGYGYRPHAYGEFASKSGNFLIR